VVLSLSHNFISGSIPNEIGGCSQLEVLQLQSNHLVGNIVPSVISQLSRLKELNLAQNGFNGDIPDEISKCSSLNLLCLDGEIPVDLSRISGLKYLNVSNNNLEGEIPEMLSSKFNDPSVYAMNKRLCGKPLHKECGKSKRRKRKKLIIIIGVAAAGLCLLALCCCGYVYSLLRWRRKLREGVTGEKKRSPTSAGSNGERNSRGSGDNGGPKLIVFNNKITYAETLEATR
ncbi:LRR receptor-like kinase, partial [Trifolium medium]|nr:LRR receptor-like kinase [Trifolium medium]